MDAEQLINKMNQIELMELGPEEPDTSGWEVVSFDGVDNDLVQRDSQSISRGPAMAGPAPLGNELIDRGSELTQTIISQQPPVQQSSVAEPTQRPENEEIIRQQQDVFESYNPQESDERPLGEVPGYDYEATGSVFDEEPIEIVSDPDDWEDLESLVQEVDSMEDFSQGRSPDSEDPVQRLIDELREKTFEEQDKLLEGIDLSKPDGANELQRRYENFYMQRINERLPNASPEVKMDILKTIFTELKELESGANSGNRQIAQNDWESLDDIIGRSPAGAKKFDPISLGGGGSPTGAAIGTAITLGMGSKMSPRERELYLMPEEQLAEQIDSAEKDKIMDLKDMEDSYRRYRRVATPSNFADLLPGYEEILLEGQHEDEHYPDRERMKYEAKKKDWVNWMVANRPYQDFDRIMDLADEKFPPFEEPKGTRAWVRGFAPNPDTFVIIEAQKNKKETKGEKKALDRAVEYARKAGYKYIGIANAESVADMQEHEEVEDWIRRRYDNSFVTHLSKRLRQSPSQKEWQLQGAVDKSSQSSVLGAIQKIYNDEAISDWANTYTYVPKMRKVVEPILREKGVSDEHIEALKGRRNAKRVELKKPLTKNIKYRVFSLEDNN